MKSKVSIIIPVYNSEKYIGKCLESVIDQTYQELEIIVINDGSKDNSLSILKEFEKKDPYRLKTFDQENIGVSSTRNNGIKYATGKYIMFLDNDDFLEKEYVETFVNQIENTDYDYIIGGYKQIDETSKLMYTKYYKDLEWSKYMFLTPWAKIYRRDFLIKNKIEFLGVKVGEDIYFSMMALTHTEKVKFFTYAGYVHLYNTKSISNTVHRKDNNDDVLRLCNELWNNCNEDFMNKNQFNVKYFLMKLIIWSSLYSGRYDTPENAYGNYCELRDCIKSKYPNYQKNMILKSPKGEDFKIKIAIKLMIIFDKLSLLKIFFNIYAKGKVKKGK